jgi:hypothetical protein
MYHVPGSCGEVGEKKMIFTTTLLSWGGEKTTFREIPVFRKP